MATAPVGSPQFSLPTLPWAENALDPVISANTISFHYGKHHKTYVDNLNKFAAGTEFADMPLEKIVNATAGKVDKTSIFNNAAQAWNHTFYWRCLRPKGGGEPPASLKQKNRGGIWRRRCVQKRIFRDRLGGVRQRLGMAGDGWQHAQDSEDEQRGNADNAGPEAAARH
jgi:hypothetical protein